MISPMTESPRNSRRSFDCASGRLLVQIAAVDKRLGEQREVAELKPEALGKLRGRRHAMPEPER